MLGFSDSAIDTAFNAGKIVRTHVLRPTWHFVLPADIRWLLELTGPRVLQQNAYMCRREGLDDATHDQNEHRALRHCPERPVGCRSD